MTAMKCPYCSYSESKVIDSRPTDENVSIRRRRECLRCERRFTTYEVVETMPLVVIKKDGSREAFAPGKLLGGMLRACEKRPVTLAILQSAVTEIETRLRALPEGEVTSHRIGEMAMEKLRTIDEVAYIRFVSVYREFGDIHTFMAELQGLLAQRESKK